MSQGCSICIAFCEENDDYERGLLVDEAAAHEAKASGPRDSSFMWVEATALDLGDYWINIISRGSNDVFVLEPFNRGKKPPPYLPPFID